MKSILIAAVLGASLLAGCENIPAQYSATPDSEKGYMNVEGGKRQEILVGSRLPRESRENAEFTKSIGRKAYQDAMTEKNGAPINGQVSGGM